MRVLFFSYPASFQNIGGGEIFVLKNKEYLEKAGVEVKLFDMWKDRVEDFDILHVFGTVKDCLGLIEVAKARRVKVAVSPIFWSSWERAIFTHGSWREKAELAARHAMKLAFPGFPSSRRRMMTRADVVFPNSEIEKRQIARLFAIPAEKIMVTHNGVDARFEEADAALFRGRYGAEPFVLGVGRIEPRKNQLNLIRAVKALEKKLVLIGNPVSGFEEYDRMCRQEGSGFVQFVPAMDHEDPCLASAYAACDCFVLQGFFETPGLAALEAVLAGARVAVTRGGSTREYFENDVQYLDPGSPSSIADAITRTLAGPPSARLKERIKNRFSWGNMAQETLKGYERILGWGVDPRLCGDDVFSKKRQGANS